MSHTLSLLTQQNFELSQPNPVGGNHIDCSALHYAEFQLKSQGFGVKYVFAGQENYLVNGTTYEVHPGQFLLVPPQAAGSGNVHGQCITRGICINLEPAILAEIWACHLQPNELYSDVDWAKNAALSNIQEGLFSGDQTGLGKFLATLARQIELAPAVDLQFQPSFFYTVAELFLDEYKHVPIQLAAISAVKKSTRQELYRRVLQGKSILEGCYTEPIEIATVARNACLSEYQFFRVFKAAFGVTPYQFVLQKRLDLGKALLSDQRFPVSEVAFQTGFSDIFSFSKAFKKRYGISPSALQLRSKLAGFDK